MKRTLKKSLPSRPMKPASRKPIEISFQSIAQSMRKLPATSRQESTRVSRRSRGSPGPPRRHAVVVLVAGVRVLGVDARLLLQPR